MSDIFRKPISMLTVIRLFREGRELDGSFCVYGYGDPKRINLESICYLDEYADFDDNDEEVFPIFVRENGLELWFTDEIIEQVVVNALHQNPEVEDSRILEGLFYYYKHDTFKDL